MFNENRLPRSGTVTLLLFVFIFIVMPIVFAWKGFAFMAGTIIFGVGLRTHLKRLSTEGFSTTIALRWRGRCIYERRLCLRASSEQLVNKLLNWVVVVLILGLVPLIGYLLQGQGVNFARRLHAQEPALREMAAAILAWAQSFAPALVPSGDLANVLSGVAGQVFGDIKSIVMLVAGQGVRLTSTLITEWIYIGISLLIVCVFMGEWDTEIARVRDDITSGISNERLRRRILRFGELYQEGLSILMIGFLEVSLTLAVIYVVLLSIFPFNLSVGAVLFIALLLGFVTAVWKVGGLIAMALSALFILLNFEAGFSWFGFGYISLGLYTDLGIKAFFIVFFSKVVGLFEAYSFTPKIIGEKLQLTKLQMVSTILIWAIGSNFFGMIWGVLLMLLYQASRRLTNEIKAEEATVAA